VDVADVVMFEGGCCFRLPDKPLLCISFEGGFRREKLEGDVAIESQVLGLVNNTHPAAAEEFEDFVVGNSPADHGPPMRRRVVPRARQFIGMAVR